MPLLPKQLLAAFAGLDSADSRLEPALAMAEALVAGWIGAPSLAGRSRSCRLLSPRFRLALELPEGPLTQLLAVREAGVARDPAAFRSGPWFIARAEGFAAGRAFEVTWRLGWSAEEGPALPEALRQALLITAADWLARGPGPRLVSQRLGDYAAAYAAAATALPLEAEALLRPWRRP